MDDEFRLPCGCVTGMVDDSFVIQACALGKSCKWVQYVIAETEAQGKPYTVVDP